MNADDLTVVFHACDKYLHFFDGCIYYFKKHWNWTFCDNVIFANERLPLRGIAPFRQLLTGAGGWGERLAVILDQITTPYVLYMQEDYWLTATPDMPLLYRYFLEHNLDGLRVQPVSKSDAEKSGPMPSAGSYGVYRVTNSWQPVISHRPCIWKRRVFKNTLRGERRPWDHERYATRRARQAGKRGEFPLIAAANCGWFAHVGHRCQISSVGKAMRDSIPDDCHIKSGTSLSEQ